MIIITFINLVFQCFKVSNLLFKKVYLYKRLCTPSIVEWEFPFYRVNHIISNGKIYIKIG